MFSLIYKPISAAVKSEENFSKNGSTIFGLIFLTVSFASSRDSSAKFSIASSGSLISSFNV